MLRKIALMILATMTITGMTGCASLLDDNWGRSYETARYNQTLDPAAERNPAVVEGLDGPSSQRVLENYREGGKQGKK